LVIRSGVVNTTPEQNSTVHIHHANERGSEATRVTLIGAGLNIILAGIKITFGLLGRSAAIIADGVHSLSDLFSDAIVIVGIRLGERPPDRDHEYGHGKFETLAAAICGIILLVAGAGIFRSGLIRVIAAARGLSLEQPRIYTLVIAFLSIAVKEGLYRYTLREGKVLKSQALVANAWHHRSDALSSIGVCFGIAGAIFLGEKWRLLDPVAALIVSVFIFKVSFSIIISGVNELLEKSLPEKTERRIEETVRNVPGVLDYHKLKTRRIGNASAIDLHIQVEPSLSVTEAHDISHEVEKKLRRVFGRDTIVSVHIEPAGKAEGK